MDQLPGQLESVLSGIPFDSIASGESEPAEIEETEETGAPEQDEVAPQPDSETTESVDAEGDSAAPPEPTPPVAEPEKAPVNFDSDDNPYKQQADKLTALFEEAQRRSEAEAETRRRDQFLNAATERLDYLQTNFNGTDEQRQAEVRRLVSEVEGEVQRQASYHIQGRDQVIEDTAAHAASVIMAIQNDPVLTDADKQRILSTSQFLQHAPTPDAMKATVQREAQLRQQFGTQTETLTKRVAELEAKLAESATARKVQQRVASGVDAVGAGVGKPANGKASPTEQTLQRLFGT